MIGRVQQAQAQKILSMLPVLGIVGPRQVGKTTMAKSLAKLHEKSIYLDLESPSDRDKLANAESYFAQFEDHLIIIDEVQLDQRLFPIIRSSVDKNRKPARFLLLGSAAPDVIRHSSESLAGRVAYIELGGLNVAEVSYDNLNDLWIRGGFPDPFLNPPLDSIWKENFIRTYLERDLPMLGLNTNPMWARRMWQMIAHVHGQTINYSDLSKSLEVDAKTIKRQLDFLESAFLIHQLRPYHANTKKRLVKAPKIYFRDSGIVHHLLGVHVLNEVLGHIKMGSTWEGFVLEQIHQLKPQGCELYFYRTHNGAELDLVIEKNGELMAGIEIKYGDNINVSRGNTEAANELELSNRFLIKQNPDDWVMTNGFRVVGLENFINQYLQSW
jgi:hypothetical protein